MYFVINNPIKYIQSIAHLYSLSWSQWGKYWFSLRRLFVLAGLSVGIKPPEGLSLFLAEGSVIDRLSFWHSTSKSDIISHLIFPIQTCPCRSRSLHQLRGNNALSSSSFRRYGDRLLCTEIVILLTRLIQMNACTHLSIVAQESGVIQVCSLYVSCHLGKRISVIVSHFIQKTICEAKAFNKLNIFGCLFHNKIF